MKTNLKKITALIMAFLVMSVTVFGISKSNVHAAGIYLSLSFSASEVSIGDEVYVTVSASSDEYFSCDINVGYDSGVLEFVGNSFGSGTTINISGTSGSGTLTFRAIASGSAYVYTSSDGYNLDGESVDISDQGAYIYVGSDETTEETTEETEETTEETTEDKSEEETTEEETTIKEDDSDLSIMFKNNLDEDINLTQINKWKNIQMWNFGLCSSLFVIMIVCIIVLYLLK